MSYCLTEAVCSSQRWLAMVAAVMFSEQKHVTYPMHEIAHMSQTPQPYANCQQAPSSSGSN